MPIPTTSMGACMRFLRREHSKWPYKQRLAICLKKTNSGKKEKK